MIHMTAMLAVQLHYTYLTCIYKGDPKTLTPVRGSPYGPGPWTTLWTSPRTLSTDPPMVIFSLYHLVPYGDV